MNKIRSEDYLYATGRLRALERSMLTARDIEKMLDAATLEESYKVANDICLKSPLGFKDYERAIGSMLADTYALIGELAGDNGIFDIFRYKYDGHNLKSLIKAQALGSDPAPLLSPLGTVAPEKLTAMFHEDKYEGLPERMAEAARRAGEALAKSGDPQQVDILLDRAVLESMCDSAGEIGFPFLTNLVRTTIDVENLRTAVRLKRMGKDLPLFKRLAVEGGKLPLARLYEAFLPEGLEALRDALAISEYAGTFGPLLEGMTERTPLTAFERAADNYLLRLIRGARYVAFGLEPVIAYLLAKENEAKVVRIVLASRAAGVAREKISERVRETYA